MRSTLVILITLLSCTMVQAQQWALIKRENYTVRQSVWLNDYETYTYSTGRASDSTIDIVYDNELKSIAYDTHEEYNGDPTNNNKMTLYLRSERTYNNDGLIDSQKRYTINKNGAFLSFLNVYYYTNGKLDSFLSFRYDNALQQMIKRNTYLYVYSKRGDFDVVFSRTIDWVSNGVVSNENVKILDSAGRVLIDSTSIPVSGIMVPWQVEYRFRDSVGNTYLYERYQYDNGNPTLQSVWLIDYDTNGWAISDSLWRDYGSSNYYTFRRDYRNNAMGMLEHSRSLEYEWDRQGTLLDTDTIEQHYRYTSFGYLESYTESEYDIVNNILSVDSSHFYYVSAAEVATPFTRQPENELIAYPVPSSNFINLKWEAAKPTTINARLVNLQGQVVKQWSDDVTGTYTKSIHVGDLPAGNYYIILEVDSNTLRKQISIQR